MQTLIIHIGYPKTATTTLQDKFFSKLNGIAFNYMGKVSLNAAPNTYQSPHLIRDLLYSDIKQTGKKFNPVNAFDKNVIVLSNEDFTLAVTDYLHSTEVRYLNPFKTAQNLNHYFKDAFHNIQILVVLRNQQSLLYSFYVEIYKWKYRLIPQLNTFNKFLSSGLSKGIRGNFMMFYYDKILDEYASFFGKENLHILFYEDLIENKNHYYSELARLFGVDESIVANYLCDEKQNQKVINNNDNYVSDDINLSYVLNKQIGKIMKSELSFKLLNYSKKFKKVNKHLYSQVLLPILNKVVIKKGIEIKKPSDEELKSIFLEFRESNQRLLKQYKLNEAKMIKYGYLEK